MSGCPNRLQMKPIILLDNNLRLSLTVIALISRNRTPAFNDAVLDISIISDIGISQDN